MSYNKTADYLDQLAEETKRRAEEKAKTSAQEALWKKNSKIEQHRNQYSLKYKIRVNNSIYNCNGFDLIILNIPVATTLNKAGRIWNSFALVVDTIAWLSGSEIFLPASENESFNLAKAVIMRLVDDNDEPVLDVVSNDERKIILDAVKHCKTKCEEIYGDIGMQILNSVCNEGNLRCASVDSLAEVINQFKLQQKEQEASTKKRKEKLYDKILSDFYASEFLNQSQLSNREKISEYSSLRDFCCKYIPVLDERGFRVESLHNDYPEYVSAEVVEAFKENWIRMSRSYSVLLRGVSGEEKVYEVLRLYDDRIRVIREYVWGHEHDFIVITPYGISTIEVKNLRGDYVLTETGILKCLSTDKVKPKDVAFQSKKHLETLRRNLRSCSAFSENVPLQEIICSAEPNFTIKDDYHYIPVCYYNTVDKALFPNEGRVVLSNLAMDAIEEYLLKNKQDAFKFDVFLPRGEIDGRDKFIKSFADVASGFMVAQNVGGDS